ncbi:hypothetical protein IWX49DRAFT_601537 [Phyllosticta citricarpa]
MFQLGRQDLLLPFLVGLVSQKVHDLPWSTFYFPFSVLLFLLNPTRTKSHKSKVNKAHKFLPTLFDASDATSPPTQPYQTSQQRVFPEPTPNPKHQRPHEPAHQTHSLAIIVASPLLPLLPRQVLQETTPNLPAATDHVLQHDPARVRHANPPTVTVLLLRHQRRRPRMQSALRDVPAVRSRQRCHRPHDAHNDDQHQRRRQCD